MYVTLHNYSASKCIGRPAEMPQGNHALHFLPRSQIWVRKHQRYDCTLQQTHYSEPNQVERKHSRRKGSGGKDQITIEKPAANIVKAGVPEVQNPQTILMFCRKIDRERQKLSVRAPEN